MVSLVPVCCALDSQHDIWHSPEGWLIGEATFVLQRRLKSSILYSPGCMSTEKNSRPGEYASKIQVSLKTLSVKFDLKFAGAII